MTIHDMPLPLHDKGIENLPVKSAKVKNSKYKGQIMKRTTTLIAALLMVIGVASATEGERTKESKVAMVKWKANTHQLFYLSKQEGKVTVKILDDEGNTLVKKSIRNEKGFALPLNFRKQAAGNYQLQVVDDEDIYTEDFKVTKE